MFAPFSDDQLADLESRYGRIAVVTGATPKRQPHHKSDPEPPWSVVYRAPTMGECDAFEGAANNERSKPGAFRELARKIVVGISHKGVIVLHDGERGRMSPRIKDAWETLRNDYPAVHLAAQSPIQELMGLEASDEGKG